MIALMHGSVSRRGANYTENNKLVQNGKQDRVCCFKLNC